MDIRQAWWCFSLLAAWPAVAAQTDAGSSSAESLVGLWGVELLVGPWVKGELIVDARGSEWRARIAGYDVPVSRQSDRLSFILPGDAGELRAQLPASQRCLQQSLRKSRHSCQRHQKRLAGPGGSAGTDMALPERS